MIVRGVDLAARYSAFVDGTSSGQVVASGDSSENRNVASAVVSNLSAVDFLVIEDLPQSHILFTGIVKSVCRTQGRIIHSLSSEELTRTFLVPPAVWQRHYPGVFRGPLSAAKDTAQELGFTPPDLLQDKRGLYEDLKGLPRQKVRARLKKISTDYVDAFLIMKWAQDVLCEHPLRSVSGIFFWDEEIQDFVTSSQKKPSSRKKPRQGTTKGSTQTS
jgi:hypothetical protein